MYHGLTIISRCTGRVHVLSRYISTMSAEEDSFIELYSDLKDGLQSGLGDITDKAFSKRLISRQTKRKVNSRASNADEAERAGILLDSLLDKIRGRSDVYYKFADILDNTVSYEYLAERMKSEAGAQSEAMRHEDSQGNNASSSYLLIKATLTISRRVFLLPIWIFVQNKRECRLHT